MNGGFSTGLLFGQPSSTGKRAESPAKGEFSVKRWESIAAVSVATLGLLAPKVAHAAATPGAKSIPGYTFSQHFLSGGPAGATDAYQSGDINNKGQFCGDPNPGEREVAFDGTKELILSDADVPIKAPDGATINNGVWSPQGINNNGIVAWIADIGDGGTGPHYVMAYDMSKSGAAAYTIVERPGDPTPEGTKYEDQNAGPGGARMLADINNKNEVFWTTCKAGADGNDYAAIYSYNLDTKKGRLVVADGSMTTDGKTIVSAWWPDTNDSSMCAMSATVDADQTSWGIYLEDGQGNITPIIPAGSTIDGVKIGSARWPRLSNNGDIVAVVDVNGTDNGGAGEVNADMGLAIYSAKDKSVHLIVKSGDKVPGGTYAGQEPSRRTMGITDSGQVFFLAQLSETVPNGAQAYGCYRWDPATNTIDALVLGNTTVGSMKVGEVTKSNGACTSYHMGVSGDGHVLFGAVINGVEGYLACSPP